MPLTIHINGHPIEISAPYFEGHPLTLGEAQALNGLRAENLRNNVRRSAAKRQIATLPEVQDLARGMDSTYKFLSQAEREARPGALRQEATAIARDEAERQARHLGLDLDPTLVEDILREEWPWEQARQRLLLRAEIAQKNLADL